MFLCPHGVLSTSPPFPVTMALQLRANQHKASRGNTNLQTYKAKIIIIIINDVRLCYKEKDQNNCTWRLHL